MEFTNEPMLDIYIFETMQLIGQLEQCILCSEESSSYTQDAVNEVFRIMHTIKGSSAMMLNNNIAALAHALEDVFYFIREQKLKDIDCSDLSDLVFEGVDFIKIEMQKMKNGDEADGDATDLINRIKKFLSLLKQNNNAVIPKKAADGAIAKKQQYYIGRDKNKTSMHKNIFKAIIYFEEGCEMENIRAYSIIYNLKDLTENFSYIPEDIVDNDRSVEIIRREGFKIYLKTDYDYDKIYNFFMEALFIKSLELTQLENEEEFNQFDNRDVMVKETSGKGSQNFSTQQNIISVNVEKLDRLMDLTGEMVIAEAMVTQNPDLDGLELDGFSKAARQLSKITKEMQDMVMSIRMVPLSATFFKMHRIVRDMCKSLGKKAELRIIGEETEVDKNIIEHISDPLMHLVRNALDHGIGTAEERQRMGKDPAGTITLEAKNVGSDVLIIIKDDGKGLNREKILKRAQENNLLYKPIEDMSDKDILNLILQPGFSTKDDISEYSGRGVGMDVVTKNVETIGGSVSVDSKENLGTTITIKIPLTLAIIDGMNIRVGDSCYTIPTISIRESFRPKQTDIIVDPDGNEMVMIRGHIYSILRLHKLYNVETKVISFSEGIVVMVEQDSKAICIFADELLGQQQVVVKMLPKYITELKKVRGITGCTLLGDGSISLILDISGLINLE